MAGSSNNPNPQTSVSATTRLEGSGPLRGSLAVGETLGEFEIRDIIGRGGMGTVYKAWQRSLQRFVALKVLAPHVSGSPNAILRFQREAQAAANLHHANIVPIYAQGSTHDCHYYAMELIDGVGLNTLVAASRAATGQGDADDIEETMVVSRSGSSLSDSAETVALPPRGGTLASGLPDLEDSAVTLGVPSKPGAGGLSFEFIAEQIACVADALEYAHGRGIIHRDIKPHNLILSRENRLQVTDFGLARVLEQPGVTLTGEFIGSPLYMSPEQISGDGSKVDHRTDIYSLAATMYEWLTLRPPFPGRNRDAVIRQVLNDDPIPPRQLNPRIPVELETICLKAMDRQRERRYATAGEFRDDLRASLAGRRIRARRAGWLVRSRRFLARHPATTLATAAVIVLAVAGMTIWRANLSLREKKRAVDEKHDLVKLHEAEVEKQVAQLDSLLEGFLEMRVLKGGAELVSEMPGMVERGRTAAGETDVPSILLGVGADVGTIGGIARRLIDTLLTASGPLDELRVQTVAIDPRLLVLRSAMYGVDPAAALRSVDAYARDPSDWTARYLRALLRGRAGQYERMLEEATELAQVRDQLADVHVVMGLAHLLLNDSAESAADCGRALAIDGGLDAARALRGLALLHQGRTAEALADFDAALARSPNLAVARLGRAFAHFAGLRYDEAIADCTYVLGLDPRDPDALVARGEFLRTALRFDEAMSDLRAANAAVGDSTAAKLRIYGLMYSTARSRSALASDLPSGGGAQTATTGESKGDAADVGGVMESTGAGSAALIPPRPEGQPPPASPYPGSPVGGRPGDPAVQGWPVGGRRAPGLPRIGSGDEPGGR